jgi:hypothetical protein
MKREDDVQGVHKKNKTERGKNRVKNQIMLNMLIAVAVCVCVGGEMFVRLDEVGIISEGSVLRPGRNSLEVTQRTITIQLPVRKC